jgi:SAM-dependent methyltransferase
MFSTDALRTRRQVWGQRPVLRVIYDDFYNRLSAECINGLTIEVGGGIGKLKEHLADVVTTDIQFATWLDCVADAQRLPFADSCAANIVMVDVMHHIEFPAAFFGEAERVLQNGGRLLMIEPAITWGSTLFYRLFHPEPVRMSANALRKGQPNVGRDPYESNQALPTILATQEWKQFHKQFPHLRIRRVDWFSLIAYPLTGGFKRRSLISPGLARRLLRIERRIEPMLGRYVGFRMMLLIEKGTR